MILLISTAFAKSWCAAPIVAHEWGVTVLTADASAPLSPELPPHFHRAHTPFATTAVAVRTLPPDSGIRTLPVMHFYSSSYADPIPLGVEVGFVQGAASIWYPAVDVQTEAAVANSPGAATARRALKRARSLEQPARRAPEGIDLGRDPTRQLHWDRLELRKSAGTAVATDHAWVEAARKIPEARWVHHRGENERFLFYEAETEEKSAVQVLFNGDTVQFRNESDWIVHDLALIREGRVAMAPALLPGRELTVRLEQLDVEGLKEALTKRWASADRLPAEVPFSGEDCVMMENPAVPVEASTGHGLYPEELEVLWSVWRERLLAPEGTRLLYREDPAALDAVMPLSLYTDQRHWIALSRLGLVVVDNLEAP